MNILVLNAPYFPKFSRPQRSPGVTKSGTLYYPIWLAYAAGVLIEEGFDVDFVDAPARDVSLDQCVAMVREKKYGLIVLDVTTPSVLNDVAVARELKAAHPDAVLVMVGTHMAAKAGETLAMMSDGAGADCAARKEYDYTVRDLALAVRDVGGRPSDETLAGIEGLSFLDSDGNGRDNPDRPFIEDLDALPWVSKVYEKYLRIEDYFNANAIPPMVTLTSSRGCPFKCSFCVYPQTLTGRGYRFRSVGDIVDEMEYVARTFPQAKSIFFEDDTLTVDKKRCREFSQMIIDRGLKMPWTANSRIDVDYETLVLMRKAGCRMLCVGFESGDPDVLKTMRKGTSRERMLAFVAEARRAGILVHGCFIFGFAGETEESIRRTIDFSIELKPDTVQYYPVMVYPGTDAYDEYREKDWITVSDYSRWLTPDGLHNCVVRNETLTPEKLVRLCDEARRKFYLRPGYFLYKLRQVLTNPSEFLRTARAGRTFFKHLLFGSKV